MRAILDVLLLILLIVICVVGIIGFIWLLAVIGSFLLICLETLGAILS